MLCLLSSSPGLPELAMPPTIDGQARDVGHPHIEQGFDLDLTSRLLNSDIGCVDDVPTLSSLRPTKLDDYIRIHTRYSWQPLSHLAPAGLPLTSPHCYSNLDLTWHITLCLLASAGMQHDASGGQEKEDDREDPHWYLQGLSHPALTAVPSAGAQQARVFSVWLIASCCWT